MNEPTANTIYTAKHEWKSKYGAAKHWNSSTKSAILPSREPVLPSSQKDLFRGSGLAKVKEGCEVNTVLLLVRRRMA